MARFCQKVAQDRIHGLFQKSCARIAYAFEVCRSLFLKAKSLFYALLILLSQVGIRRRHAAEIRRIELLLALCKEALLLIMAAGLIGLDSGKFICRKASSFLMAFGNPSFMVLFAKELGRMMMEDLRFHSLLRAIESLKVRESKGHSFQAFLSQIGSIEDEIMMKYLVQYQFKLRL